MATIKDIKHISILGFKNVELGNIEEFLKKVNGCIYPAMVQIVDAINVAGRCHLFFAFLNAQKSFEEGRAISETFTMETLLYASANRQIVKAIAVLGIKPYTSEIAAMIFSSSDEEAKEAESKLETLVAGVRDDSVLEIKGKKVQSLIKCFGITELELETMVRLGMTMEEVLTWLIVERVSLISIKR